MGEEGARWQRRHIEGARWGRESAVKVGRTPGRGEGAGAAGHGGGWRRAEVGDAPDGWARPVGERVRKWRERWAGGGLLGRERSSGPNGLCGCG
jgi:hypothetical protein